MQPDFNTFLLKQRIARARATLNKAKDADLVASHQNVGAGKKPDKKHKDNNPIVERKPMPEMPKHAQEMGDDAYPHSEPWRMTT